MITGKAAILLGANLVFLLALFPYITPATTRFDTQPWAIIAAVIVISLLLVSSRRFALPLPMALILLIVLYASGAYLIHSDAYYGLRSLVGYFSVFLLAVLAYKTWRLIRPVFYVWSVAIWLVVGIIQLAYDYRFGEWLLPRLSTGGSRGVTSLAVEPSYYAIVCIFMLILNEFFYQERRYGRPLYFGLLGVLVFQIVISFSVTGLLFITIFGAVKLFQFIETDQHRLKLGAHLLPSVIMLAATGLFLQSDLLQNTRAGAVAARAFSDPVGLFQRDESIATRTLHLILPVYSLPIGNGLGMGLGTWNDHYLMLLSSAGEWVPTYISTTRLVPGGRIASGWGTAIYELGLVGLIFTAILLQVMWKSYRRNERMRPSCRTSMIILVALMTMAVPLAFPLFGYVLGIHFYYAYADPLRDQGQHSVSTLRAPSIQTTMPAGHLGGST